MKRVKMAAKHARDLRGVKRWPARSHVFACGNSSSKPRSRSKHSLLSANWIEGDESAKQMLARVLAERPLLLLPPLHHVPLRVGNVVEIVGPSPSAKTQILLQAAVNCILPKEWNGVHYGGLERSVMYFDLDCRFDILRFSQLLKHHITMASGSSSGISPEQRGDNYNGTTNFDEELFRTCMRRFLYIRCYSSFEFLTALRQTMRNQFQKETATHDVAVHFLMIDSIGAFYWVDRSSKSLPLEGDNRKYLSLQSVAETVVQEIRKLLQVQPMLVLATKTNILGMGAITSDVKRTFRKWTPQDTLNLRTSSRGMEEHMYREYMPLVWQSFVTHRILLHVSDENFVEGEHQELPIYVAEWVLPSLNFSVKFTVKDAGIFMVA